MSNTVRILRSTTAGNVPSSLVSGQIAVNEADGRLFYRSASGAVTAFSSIAPFATTASFPATGSSGVLYLASDSSRLFQFAGGVYVELGVSGGGGSGGGTPSAHASTHAAGGSDAITPTSIGAAAASHTHAASDIASGTIDAARLGSGTANSTTYLRGDQTWATVSSGVADGNKGDITVSGSGGTWTINANAVTEADLANAVRNSIFHPFLLMGG